jgi:hypothetical protein
MTSSSIPKQRKLIDLQKQKEVNELQMKMKISKLKNYWIWPRWRATKRRGLEGRATAGMKAISQILTSGYVALMEWKTVPSIVHRRRHSQRVKVKVMKGNEFTKPSRRLTP